MCQTQCIAQRPLRPRGRRIGVDIDHELLRQTRRDAGLSLAQVAGSELTRQAVHLIETGKVRPSRESLEVIAARVGRPAHEFLDHAGRAVDGPRLTEFEELCERHRYADLLRQAEDVLRKGAPPRHRAVAHFYAGRAHHQLNRHDEALEHLARAEELAGAVDNPWLAAEAIEWQAAALHRKADLGALGRAEEALRRYRKLRPRHPAVEVRMIERVGACLIARRDYERARGRLNEALELLGTRGAVRDLEGMGRIYHDLAGCARAQGDLRRAVDLMERAVSLYSVEHDLRPVRSDLSLPRAENDLGLLLMQLAQHQRAGELLQTAESRFAEAGADLQCAYVRLSRAELRQAEGRIDEALELAREALELSADLGDPMLLGCCHQDLGELHAARGERAAFEASFQRALAILTEAGLRKQEVHCRQAYQRLSAQFGAQMRASAAAGA